MIAWNPSPENPSADRGECFVATGAAIAMAIAAGASAGGAAYAAHSSSNAARDAAKYQTDAANHGADLQKQSNDEALKFQEQQAAEDKARFEASQRANYNQYLARYNAAKGLGASMGFTLPDAPDYNSATGAGGPASGGGADPKAVAFIRDYQAKNPSSGGVAPMLAAAKAQGVNISPFMYGQTPSGNEVDIPGYGKYKVLSEGNGQWYQGGNDSPGGAMAPTTGAYLPSSIGSYLPQGAPSAPMMQPTNLQAPSPFKLRGIASYLGGR